MALPTIDKIKTKKPKGMIIHFEEDWSPCGCDRDAFTDEEWFDPKHHGCLNEDGTWREDCLEDC